MSARGWLPLDGAPKDGTRILLLTSDFGAVEGYWDVSVTNFYKSQVGWDSYDPDNAQGDWVSEWRMHESPGDYRLYCGCTPQRWMPLVASGIDDEFDDEETPDANGWMRIPDEVDRIFAPFDGVAVLLHVEWEPMTVVGFWDGDDWCAKWDDTPLGPGFDLVTHWKPLDAPVKS